MLALLTAGTLLCADAAQAQHLVGPSLPPHKVQHGPLPEKVFRQRVAALVSPQLLASLLRPVLVVSPGHPMAPGRAYLRVASSAAVIEMDAQADALAAPVLAPNLQLQVFVHGQPDKLTVLDCGIDGAPSLISSVQLGADAAHLTPDPQGRSWTNTAADGHFTFIVPQDLPGASPSNWFAVELKAPSGTPPSTYFTFYGCSIWIGS
jgi:hypothetical protein